MGVKENLLFVIVEGLYLEYHAHLIEKDDTRGDG